MGWCWVASCRNPGQPGPRFPKRRTRSPRLIWLRRPLDEKPTSERREGWPPLPGNVLRDSITISVCSLDQMKVHCADPVKVFVASLDGERAALAHLHAPHMGPRCFAFARDDGPHPVARLEACDLLLPHLVASRKSFLRPVGAAMVAPSVRPDHKRFELAWPDACQIPDAQGIEGMGLLHSEPRPVPPCPPACPGTDGQAKDAQDLNELVSGGIDRRCITERHFGLLLDLRVSPLGGSLIPLLLIAAVTGQRQIRDAVGPTPAAGSDVVYFKGRLPLPTIDASVLILEKQI